LNFASEDGDNPVLPLIPAFNHRLPIKSSVIPWKNLTMLYLLEPPIEMLNHIPDQPLNLPLAHVMACPNLVTAVAVVAEIYDFQWHPYLLWMRSLAVDRAVFLQSQLPLQYAIEAFSQGLAALSTRVDNVATKQTLIALMSVHQGHSHPLQSDQANFRQYLKSLGATDTDLKKAATVEVLEFRQSILNHCLTQSPESSAAMLGAVEYLHQGIQSTIARMIHGCGWVAPGSQFYYQVQTSADGLRPAFGHQASPLWQIATPGWENLATRESIAQGLMLGAHCFWSLYEGIPIDPAKPDPV
jgi:pyrroloquinoline-quinone synthase